MACVPNLSRLSLACKPCAVPVPSWDAVAKEPTVKSHPMRKQILETIQCAICLAPIEQTAWQGDHTADLEVLTEISCGHVFHRTCLQNWLRTGRHECPMDRLPIDPDVVTRLVPNSAQPNLTQTIVWDDWDTDDEEDDDDYQGDVNFNAMLFQEVRANNLPMVRELLLKDETNVNTTDDSSSTPLMWAALLGNLDIVRLLLVEEGLDINRGDRIGETALAYAVRGTRAPGQEMVVREILTRQAASIDVNAVDHQDVTALMNASSDGNAPIVRILLRVQNINVNMRDDDGKTALAYALENGNEEVIALLRDARAVV